MGLIYCCLDLLTDILIPYSLSTPYYISSNAAFIYDLNEKLSPFGSYLYKTNSSELGCRFMLNYCLLVKGYCMMIFSISVMVIYSRNFFEPLFT